MTNNHLIDPIRLQTLLVTTDLTPIIPLNKEKNPYMITSNKKIKEGLSKICNEEMVTGKQAEGSHEEGGK